MFPQSSYRRLLLAPVFLMAALTVLAGASHAKPPATPAPAEPAKSSDDALPEPLTPEQSLAAISVSSGLRVELVVAEPLVVDPVALDWGADGRLWVVEMGDYPNGLDGPNDLDGHRQAGGRVRMLQDTDGDGRYDHSTIFLDDLPFPTGVKAWRQGVLVTVAPNILYAEDLDGDGRADIRKTVYEGFIEGNQQHRVNGLRWGLDNWLYLANGDSGGRIKSVKTDQTADIRGRDLRIRPDEGLLDPQSGQTQFGRDRDDWGNWFGGNNSNPLWHYVLADHYVRRNPHYAPASVKHVTSEQPGAAPVYPVSRTLTRFNDFEKANRFTSACSPMIYRDSLLGEAFAGNVFLCEPVHNLVHREIVEPHGATFRTRRADDEQQSEFLASTDNWFRPTMVRTGPDGALWIVDMYRLVIEHPEWIPATWQRKLNLRAGDDRGRIYRVLPAGQQRPAVAPRLDQRSTPELVAALDSGNGWQRDMAQQLLLSRGDREAVGPLATLVRESESPLARLHALCTLDGLSALDPPTLLVALDDPHPGVRRHAVRLAEPMLSDQAKIVSHLLAMGDDTDPQVRLQLACTLGAIEGAAAANVLAQLILADPDDTYLVSAVLSSLHRDNVRGVLDQVLARSSKDQQPASFEKLTGQLLAIASGLGDREVIGQTLRAIAQPGDREPGAWQLTALAGLLDLVGGQRSQPARLFDSKTLEALQPLLDRARQLAADDSAALTDRLVAVRLVGRAPGSAEDDSRILAGLLLPQQPPELQVAGVAALQQRAGDDVPGLLLADWSSHTPALRRQILDVLLGRDGWTIELLEAVKSGRVQSAHLDARTRQQLAQHPSEAIRQQASDRFSGEAPSARREVLESFRAAMTTAGDVGKGREVFVKKCAACHRLQGTGNNVGPDLMALTDKSASSLLVAILDPNRAVEDRFLEYQVVTVDGRQWSGMLAGETGNAVTLQGPDGKQQQILRDQIELLRTTGKSLMPEGLEREVSVEDTAGLIAYIRSVAEPPKQFEGNAPQLAPIRDDGSIRLLAMHARIYGPSLVFEPKYRNLGYWQHVHDRAEWSLQVPKAGAYRVVLDYACDGSAAGNSVRLDVLDQSLVVRVAGTGSWDEYGSLTLGVVNLPQGAVEVLIRSDGPIRNALLDLRGVRLSPMK